MNPNDILQQQQAMLDQMMHRSEQFYIIMGFFMLVGAAINAWIIYMFYRCQRDAADELRKIRVAYQFAVDRQLRAGEKPLPPSVLGGDSNNPFAASSEDDKYKPKA